jgi:hypothetical protein
VNVAVLLTYKKRGFLAEIGPFIGNASQGEIYDLVLAFHLVLPTAATSLKA